ncbi:MAG TPA: HK97 family phage prohead protease [Beijerinckiaceae bacterium]|jgi:HK97 family phage prohead protease
MERLEIKADLTVSEAGAIAGIAWPFNAGPDLTGDTITKGAFNLAVDDLPMLLGHDPEQVIGTWEEVTETDRGLEVRGRLFLEESRRSRAVRSLITGGLIGGLSIGFRTKTATGSAGKNRVITALDLFEVSVVRNPAHPRARVTGVKSGQAAIALAEAINRAASALRSGKTV